MVRVLGVSLRQLDERADAFAEEVARLLGKVVNRAARQFGGVLVAQGAPASAEPPPAVPSLAQAAISVDDLNILPLAWNTAVEATLVPMTLDEWVRATVTQAEHLTQVLSAETLSQITIPVYSERDAATLFLAQARNRLSEIGNILWENARVSMVEGQQLGESIPKLAARVRDAAGVSTPRAVVIARTEVIGAANAGSLQVMRATGLVTVKEWLATPDPRTRPTHAAANGQRVFIDEKFSVGGWPADRPHDPILPPGESVNCRCTMVYDVTTSDDTIQASATMKSVTKEASMPWHIVRDHAGCGSSEPYAVVKDDDGSIEGCHTTRDAAETQLAALYASEENTEVTVTEDFDEITRRVFGETPIIAQEEDECPSGTHRMPDGSCMANEDMGGDPSKGTKKDRRLRRNRRVAQVEDIPEDGQGEDLVPWEGTIVIEGEQTGDGREFAPGSLTWPNPDETPMALQWQKETSHGGINDVTVNVGRILSIRREGNRIVGRGVVDAASEDGVELARRLDAEGHLGVSIVADDPDQEELEFVFPEGCPAAGPSLDEILEGEMDMRCMSPEYVIFHSGRIRALTVVDIPAFVDAKIMRMGDEAFIVAMTASMVDMEVETLGAVMPHSTATTDGAWDGSANEGRLPSPLLAETARQAYAWIDDGAVKDGEVAKSAARFIHHEVNDDGSVGSANLTACSSGIGIIHGGRGGTDVANPRGVYNHLAGHLRDAGREPPPFSVADTVEALTAAAHIIEIPDVPPAEWFSEPTEVPAIGAFTVTDEGRVYGYLAPRGVLHRGYAHKRVEVPMRNVDYAHWMNRATIVAGGERIPTGVITMDCGHAEPVSWVDAGMAQEHYDNTCSVVATVRIGENQRGVWIAGALLHDVTPSQVARMLACQLSGDWRPHRERHGQREFCAALLVPVPGFPMANARSSVRLDDHQLVASTVPVRWQRDRNPVTAAEELPSWEEVQARFKAQADELAAEVGLDRQSRLAALAATVHGR